mgnify:CR=1 FL=1
MEIMEKLIFIFEHQEVTINGIERWFSSITKYRIAAKARTVDNALKVIEQAHLSEHQCAVAIMGLSFRGTGEEPNEDGLAILEAIKRSKKNIRALMFTSRDAGCHVRKVMSEQYGAKGFVSKNAGRDTLFEALEAVFEGKTYIQHELNATLNEVNSLYATFTPKERTILHELQRGLSNQQVAEELGLSLRTVENHISHIYTKTGVNDKHLLFIKIGMGGGINV